MPKFFIYKEIQAKNLKQALSQEKKAQVFKVEEIEDKQQSKELASAIGFTTEEDESQN